MTGAERGFLLLTSMLGNPQRKPLSVAQMRVLGTCVQGTVSEELDRDLTLADLKALGYGDKMAARILTLLSEEELLSHYLQRSERAGCVPLSRVSAAYPKVLLNRLGLDSPGCLWAKGDLSILNMPKVSLVGSRDIHPNNAAFAREVGAQAARQGYALISGNARGSDSIAQRACLENGGCVICVIADSLLEKPIRRNLLYLSENDFEQGFSTPRAISRNRVIHALGQKTFVAQCASGTGGTWDGTMKNLRNRWSPVFCMNDGSKASRDLRQMGAICIDMESLADFSRIKSSELSLFYE